MCGEAKYGNVKTEIKARITIGGTLVRNVQHAMRCIGAIALLLASMLALPATPVHAATNHVTNCNGSGPGSLPGQVSAAAAGDTIVFDLDCPTANFITLPSELVIDKNLTIDGSGHSVGVTRVGVTQNDNGRVMRVTSGVTVAVTALTIAGGYLIIVGGYECGAGINNAGTLTLLRSTVSGNTAIATGFNGGGICNIGTLAVVSSTINGNATHDAGGGGIFNDGTLTVQDSVIRDNRTFDQYSYGTEVGGGIDNDFGKLTVTNTAFINNNGGEQGGGIASVGVSSTATVTNSTFVGNTAYNGGGIANRNHSQMTVTGSSIESNTGSGGGIANDQSTFMLADSSVSNNSTGVVGNAGGISNGGTLTVLRSTISGNTAIGTQHPLIGGDVGGIDNGGALTVTNSTINGNTANNDDIGIRNFDGNVAMTNSTVSGNGRDGTSDISNGGGVGAGIFGLTNSIIGGNSYGAYSSGGHNLLGNTTYGSGFIATDLQNVDPKLMPLGNYGGPTQTMALQPNSPAIDRIPPTGANCPATDQRGVVRPQGPGCDIGAYESRGSLVQSIAVTPASGATTMLKTGQTASLKATGTYDTGSTADVSGQVQWSSDKPSVAQVNATGVVTGETPGAATITATLGTAQGQIAVAVSAPTPIGITAPPVPASRPAEATSAPGPAPAPAPAPRTAPAVRASGATTPGGSAPAPLPPSR